MLDIGPSASAGASYYLRALSDHRGGAEVAGATVASTWHGAGAQALGLQGAVDPDAFAAVLHGRHPVTNTTLRRHPVRVQARDCVFRPPKSVSVLAALDVAVLKADHQPPQSVLAYQSTQWGDPGAVAGAVWRAHHAGVADALAYLEGELFAASLAGEGQSVPGSPLPERAGLVVAAFDHELSRAQDPLVHTYAVMINAVGIGEDRWVPVDSRELFGQRETAAYLYHCALRAELSAELGVRWTPTVGGIAEIEGVSWAVTRAFSQRRVAIEEALRRDGRHGAVASRIAALRTRADVGPAAAPQDLQEEWLQRAQRLGFGREERAAVLAFSLATAHLGSRPERTRFHGHVLADVLGEHSALGARSSFDRRDLLRACTLAVSPGARAEQISQAADGLLGRGDVVALDVGTLPRTRADVLWRRNGNLVTLRARPRYALVATRERERVLVARALAPSQARRGLSDAAGLGRVAAPSSNSGGVEHAPGTIASIVGALRGQGPQVRVVVVRPGARTLDLIDRVRQEWHKDGWEVQGVASGRDVRMLREATGIETTAAASLRAAVRSRSGPAAPRGIVVLGAAELEREQLADLVTTVQRHGGQILLVEDGRVPAYDTSGVLRALRAREPLVLDAPSAPRERDAVSGGRSDEPVWESEQGIVLTLSAEAAHARAVAQWTATRLRPSGAVLVADDTGVRNDLNARAHRALQDLGAVAPDGLRIGCDGYGVGDRVRVVRTLVAQRVQRGSYGDVREATPAGLRVQWDAGEENWVPTLLVQDRALQHAYAVPSRAVQRDARAGDGPLLLVCAGAAVTTSPQRGDRRFCVTTTQGEHDVDKHARVGGLPEFLGIEAAHAGALQLLRGGHTAQQQSSFPAPSANVESNAALVDRVHACVERLNDVHAVDASFDSPSFDSLGAPAPDPTLHAAALEYVRVLMHLSRRVTVEAEAAEILQPAWVRATVGALPEDLPSRTLWRSGLRMVSAARLAWGIQDEAKGLGPEPCQPDRRVRWGQLRARVEQVRILSTPSFDRPFERSLDRCRERGASIER